MSNTKHTPGPWEARWETPWTEEDGGELSINAIGWERLALVYACEGVLPEEGGANARLIAAAPRMYDRLVKEIGRQETERLISKATA